jgi:benzoyl-CoA reductase/2-hydroxyglutaryl-CoA dehydratase subunit BcrC/BadD/HgdB
VKVVVTSPWVPCEWIEAHGHEPVGVWSLRDPARVAVAEGVCAIAQRSRSLADADPSRAVVFTTSCDQMRRAGDAAAEAPGARSFLFNLPATWQTTVARRLYHQEVQRLGRFLEHLGGRAPTALELTAVMRRYDRRRQSIATLAQRVGGREGAEVMLRCFEPASPDEAGGALDKVAPQRAQQEEEGGTATSDQGSAGTAIALVGGPLLPSQWDLFDAIEGAGGRVVLNGTEPGERCLLPALPATQAPGDPGLNGPATCGAWSQPLDALCDHYFDHVVDVFPRPNARLYKWLGPRLTKRKVRGLVLWVHVGCDLWRAEAASLREAFELPVLVLDTAVGRAGGGRELNRLAAFMESLR